MRAIGLQMAWLVEEPDSCPGVLRGPQIFGREEQFLSPLYPVARICGDNAAGCSASGNPDNDCQEERFHHLNPP